MMREPARDQEDYPRSDRKSEDEDDRSMPRQIIEEMTLVRMTKSRTIDNGT